MADGQDHQLVLLTQASQLLANARTIEDIKQVRNVAEAARVFARAAQMGLELQNQAAEVKLRAERKAGQFLAELCLRGGDRKSNRHRTGLKLADMGISEDQSRTWQTLASVSEEDFNQFVEATVSRRKEITAAALMRLARKRKESKKSRKAVIIEADGSSKPQSHELTELVQELRNHRDLLANILHPVFNGGDSRLRTAECRAVGHLLDEMNVTLLELEKQVRRMKWLEGMNGKASS